MAWTLAFDHLCRYVDPSRLNAFNEQLPRSFTKAKICSVDSIDDFGKLRESDIFRFVDRQD